MREGRRKGGEGEEGEREREGVRKKEGESSSTLTVSISKGSSIIEGVCEQVVCGCVVVCSEVRMEVEEWPEEEDDDEEEEEREGGSGLMSP